MPTSKIQFKKKSALPKNAVKSLKSAKKVQKPAVKKMRVSSASSRLLNDKKTLQLQRMHAQGKHTGKELAEKFGLSISSYYNYLNRKV